MSTYNPASKQVFMMDSATLEAILNEHYDTNRFRRNHLFEVFNYTEDTMVKDFIKVDMSPQVERDLRDAVIVAQDRDMKRSLNTWHVRILLANLVNQDVIPEGTYHILATDPVTS